MKDLCLPHLGWLRYPADDEVLRFLAEGWFEQGEQAFWWLALRPGDTVIDCGAHAGLYTRLGALAASPGGRVIAVEPVGMLADLIGHNTHDLPGVEIERAAVGRAHAPARVSLEPAGRLAYSSTLGASGQGFEIPGLTIDEIVENRGIERVAILKLDIEGAERDALAGAACSFARGIIDIVMVEFDEKILRRRGSSTDELLGALRETGLNPHVFRPATRTLEPLTHEGPLWYDNVFAVRDADAVRARLAQADADRTRIAEDLALRSAFAGRLAARAAEAGGFESQRDEQAGYASRLEGLLREANEDRSTLRAVMGEAVRRLVGEIAGEDAAVALGSASNRVVDELDALREQAGRQARDLEEARARQERAERESSDWKQQRDRAVERAESIRHERDRLEFRLASATESLASASGLADRLARDLLRLLRLPLAKSIIRMVTPDRAPWIDTLDEDLGQLRRSWISPEPTPERADAEPGETPPLVSPDTPDLAVIICTHNPRRDLLAWTLDSIRLQTIDPARFDLIIVDNNSTPPLDPGDLDPDGSLRLRVVRETRPGLTCARIAGLRATDAPLLAYVDDDNALAPDYLEQALRIARREPGIGSFGGVAEPVLEGEPPGWIADLLGHLGVRNHGPDPITSSAAHWGEWDPIGAGMVVRRPVAERYAAMVEQLDLGAQLGRRGNILLSGEDTLMNRCANLEGLACSYQPVLRLRHYMKKNRLTGPHIRRTIEGHGMAFVVLERVQGREVAPIRGPRGLAWLGARALLRMSESLKAMGKAGFTGALRRGYALWRWDVGYARASARPSGATHQDTVAR